VYTTIFGAGVVLVGPLEPLLCYLYVCGLPHLGSQPSRDVITWSTLIVGYAQHGQGKEALDCFERMQREGTSPNAVTVACIVKDCGSIGALVKGEQIHDEISR
jgi:pentatricopeptide repeat protein